MCAGPVASGVCVTTEEMGGGYVCHVVVCRPVGRTIRTAGRRNGGSERREKRIGVKEVMRQATQAVRQADRQVFCQAVSQFGT